MSSEWRSPQGEAQLTGSVVYRCHSCGADIEDGVTFVDPSWTLEPGTYWAGEPPLTPQTKTYHPTHLPVTED